MKKLTVLLLMMTMTASLAACGNSNTNESSAVIESTPVVESSVEESVEESIEEVIPEDEMMGEMGMSEEMTGIQIGRAHV